MISVVAGLLMITIAILLAIHTFKIMNNITDNNFERCLMVASEFICAIIITLLGLFCVIIGVLA